MTHPRLVLIAIVLVASGSATAQARGHSYPHAPSYYDATDVARDNHGRILPQCPGNARSDGVACQVEVRYQLPQPTVSPLFDANHFAASTVAMVLRAVTPTRRWLDDFQSFLALFGQSG